MKKYETPDMEVVMISYEEVATSNTSLSDDNDDGMSWN